jgi:hypothetical protein
MRVIYSPSIFFKHYKKTIKKKVLVAVCLVFFIVSCKKMTIETNVYGDGDVTGKGGSGTEVFE